MAGRNHGLTGLRFVLQILVPSALPSVLSSLRIGWVFAWRTFIAVELFFGASSGRGGLGWYIFQNRNELLTERDSLTDRVVMTEVTIRPDGVITSTSDTTGPSTISLIVARNWLRTLMAVMVMTTRFGDAENSSLGPVAVGVNEDIRNCLCAG